MGLGNGMRRSGSNFFFLSWAGSLVSFFLHTKIASGGVLVFLTVVSFSTSLLRASSGARLFGHMGRERALCILATWTGVCIADPYIHNIVLWVGLFLLLQRHIFFPLGPFVER